MKIAIIGYSGSGKSTLAERLSSQLPIPKLHMDTLQFQPGWQTVTKWMDVDRKENFLTKHEVWVIDGNYLVLLWRKNAESDQIIFLNFSPWRSLSSLQTYLTYWGKAEKKAAGCPERALIGIYQMDSSGMGRTKNTNERYQRVQENTQRK